MLVLHSCVNVFGPCRGTCKQFLVVSLFVISHVQPKCERYWCDEMNKPLELPDRGFTVTMTGKKVYADYEIRDMTIICVSLRARS